MEPGKENSLDLNNLEEELELLLQQNLPKTNKNTSAPIQSTSNAPIATNKPVQPIEAIKNARQTLKELMQETNSNETTQNLEEKVSQPIVNSIKANKRQAPIVDTINLKDLHIEPTLVVAKEQNKEINPTAENIGIPTEEIAVPKEEPVIEETNTLTKSLEDFLSEETPNLILEENVPENSIINNAYTEKSSIFIELKKNIILITLGFISLISAFAYYVYVYQPYAPSIIYADKTPYKTKNMIENLENQNILSVQDIKNKQNQATDTTSKVKNTNNKPIEETKNTNTVTITQPFIKPIEKPKQKQQEKAVAVIPKVAPNPVATEKTDTNSLPPSTTSEIQKADQLPIPTKKVEPTIIKIKAPKTKNVVKVEKKPFTKKDTEFDNDIEPQIKNIFTEKPVIKKTQEIKPKSKSKTMETNLDPWQANQLKKAHLGFYVQLASNPVRNKAIELQKIYNTRFHDILNGRHIMVEKSNLINNKIYYRLRVKAPTLEAARSICTKIKNAGGQCIYGTK